MKKKIDFLLRRNTFFKAYFVCLAIVLGAIQYATAGMPPIEPVVGERSLLVILVDFPDKPFVKTKANFNDFFNKEGFSQDRSAGSVRDYWLKASHGKLDVKADVYGVYRMPQNIGYYDSDNVSIVSEMVLAAITAAHNDGANLSKYDWNNDGVVDGVHIIFAGYSQQLGAAKGQSLYPSMGDVHVDPEKSEGISQIYFSTSAELRGKDKTAIDGIGTACYLLGRKFGLPDFADASYTGMGDWCLMANGQWGGNPSFVVGEGPQFNSIGCVPALPSAWCRAYLGWVTPIELKSPQDVTLPNPASEDVIYRINTATPGEYFLLENRQKQEDSQNYNLYLPLTGGMLIYHVNENDPSWSNNTVTNKGLYLKLARGENMMPDLVIHSDNALYPIAGCPLGKPNARLTDKSTPNAKSWAGVNTGKPVTQITKNGNGSISFKFMESGYVDSEVETYPSGQLFADETCNFTSSQFASLENDRIIELKTSLASGTYFDLTGGMIGTISHIKADGSSEAYLLYDGNGYFDLEDYLSYYDYYAGGIAGIRGEDGYTFRFTAKQFKEFDNTSIYVEGGVEAELISLTVTCGYEVTFDNGYSKADKIVVCKGSVAAKPKDPVGVSAFEGWYLGNTLFNFSTPITGNITLTAKWAAVAPPTYMFTDSEKLTSQCARWQSDVGSLRFVFNGINFHYVPPYKPDAPITEGHHAVLDMYKGAPINLTGATGISFDYNSEYANFNGYLSITTPAGEFRAHNFPRQTSKTITIPFGLMKNEAGVVLSDISEVSKISFNLRCQNTGSSVITCIIGKVMLYGNPTSPCRANTVSVKAETKLNIGAKETLIATTGGKTVTWKSSNEKVATVSTTGEVTAVSEGTAIITATANDGDFAQCKVTVCNCPSITIKWTHSWSCDEVFITASDGTPGQPPIISGKSIKANADGWYSYTFNDMKEVNLSISGNCTMSRLIEITKDACFQILSAKDGDGYNKYQEIDCPVVVAVTGVTLNKTATTLTVNATEQLTATVAPANATNKTVTWSSSKTAVATVSAAGLVTAKTVGTATITVTTTDGSKTAQCVVTVNALPIPQGTVIADCETAETNLCTPWWNYFGDKSTVSTVAIKQDGAAAGNGYASVTFNIVSGDWGIFGFELTKNAGTLNLTGATGVTFYHKGAAGTVQVGTTQYAETFSANVVAHAEWTLVTVPFSSMKGTYGSNNGLTLTNLTAVKLIQFAPNQGSGTFSVDNVQIDNIDLTLCVPVTGINDVKANGIIVYPNPTSGIVTILGVETLPATSPQNVEIYDNAGRLVETLQETRHATSLHGNGLTIDISHLPNGIYFVQINGTRVKIVKQ